MQLLKDAADNIVQGIRSTWYAMDAEVRAAVAGLLAVSACSVLVAFLVVSI